MSSSLNTDSSNYRFKVGDRVRVAARSARGDPPIGYESSVVRTYSCSTSVDIAHPGHTPDRIYMYHRELELIEESPPEQTNSSDWFDNLEVGDVLVKKSTVYNHSWWTVGKSYTIELNTSNGEVGVRADDGEFWGYRASEEYWFRNNFTPAKPKPIQPEAIQSPQENTAQSILNEALSIVTGARRQAHGEPERCFGTIAELWNTYLHATNFTTGDMVLSSSDVAVMMNLLKVARIAHGHANRDNFVDGAGYMALAWEVAN